MDPYLNMFALILHVLFLKIVCNFYAHILIEIKIIIIKTLIADYIQGVILLFSLDILSSCLVFKNKD
jgi:hypothetical protein